MIYKRIVAFFVSLWRYALGNKTKGYEMQNYKVGFIYTRCFIQKPLEISSGVTISPLSFTGFEGMIHDARKKLQFASFNFGSKDLKNTLKNFSKTGPCTLVKLDSVEAENFIQAIETTKNLVENVIGAISVISANPAVPLCAFATNGRDSGVKFFVPNDRIIRHGTNIPGYMDALPDLEKAAQSDTKMSLLLRLFRASLREQDIDHQVLFLLILFEEASDGESGTLAERLRKFSDNLGFSGDLAIIATDCGVALPNGKDVIDLIVKLRNAAAHNGSLSENSLKEYKAAWAIPVIADKEKLHKLLVEATRYMFCCMVGHTRDKKAMKVTGSIEIKFN